MSLGVGGNALISGQNSLAPSPARTPGLPDWASRNPAWASPFLMPEGQTRLSYLDGQKSSILL